MTVQENGHAGNRDVRKTQDDKKYLPARKAQQSVGQPVNGSVKYSRIE
jgi:hypothetical protein